MGWLQFGTALLGIIGTVLAYELNPVMQARKKLAQVLIDIQTWEKKRDEALAKNDANAITVAVAKLSGLQHSKASLLQQLGVAYIG